MALFLFNLRLFSQRLQAARLAPARASASASAIAAPRRPCRPSRALSTIACAMATRIRRRRRKPHSSRWHKIAIPVAVVGALLAIAGGDRRRLGAQRLQLGAAALEPEAGPEGPLLGDLRRRRQPDRLHPLQQHPPAGLRRGAAADAQGRDGRDRGQELLPARRARPERHRPRRLEGHRWPAASRSRAPRRSPSSWSATSTSSNPEETIEAKADRSPPRRRTLRRAHAATGSSPPTSTPRPTGRSKGRPRSAPRRPRRPTSASRPRTST